MELGCATCKSRCCGFTENKKTKKINIFRGETGSNIDNEKFVQEMPLIDNKCKYLAEDGIKCSIYNDPNRSATCQYYPFTMDLQNKMYLSTTCPDYHKIIDGLTKNDLSTMIWVAKMRSEMEKLDIRIKEFWNYLNEDRAVLIEVVE